MIAIPNRIRQARAGTGDRPTRVDTRAPTQRYLSRLSPAGILTVTEIKTVRGVADVELVGRLLRGSTNALKAKEDGEPAVEQRKNNLYTA